MTTLTSLWQKLKSIERRHAPVVFGGDIYKPYPTLDGIVLTPELFCSYRGHYDQAALTPARWAPVLGHAPISVEELTARTYDAIGRSFRGWKGGEYTMGADTPVWAAEMGDDTGIAVLDVVETAERVLLVTYSIDEYR